MKECKFCASHDLVKNGMVRGKQRYLCQTCSKNQISGDSRVKYPDATRQLALAMYLNSMGFRSIGRVLGVSFQIVHSWIKKAGKLVEKKASKLEKKPKEIAILEMDELYTYIKKKSGKYEYGLLLIGTEMRLLRIT
jgi:transposase-like protein